MSFTRHDLNIYPIPKEKTPMFINEPWLSDLSLLNEEIVSRSQTGKKTIQECIFQWI